MPEQTAAELPRLGIWASKPLREVNWTSSGLVDIQKPRNVNGAYPDFKNLLSHECAFSQLNEQ
jgi:hypothetical protein